MDDLVWITTAEAVELSGYHVESVRELLRDGKIRGRKFGPVWQIDRDSLDLYLRQAQARGAKPGPKADLALDSGEPKPV